MTGAIGYYVHHHGAGHWQRACLVASALDRPVTLIGSFAGIDTRAAPGPVLDLPDDRLGDAAAFDGIDGEASRPLALHYAPLRHAGLRTRMSRIAAWIAQTAPTMMIVDVSVEVTFLARLLSVPTLVVRLAGERTDLPHCEAFRSASRLIAPFPESLDGDVAGWVRDKTFHAGFLAPEPPALADTDEDGRIVVLLGRGGTVLDLHTLAEAARAVPERDWHVLGLPAGPLSGGDVPANLHCHGWVAATDPHLARAALVVGGAGDGVLGTVAAHGKRFLCLPEPRPYAEQTAKAAALARIGAAVVHEGAPPAEAWRPLVTRALALDPAPLAALFDAEAVTRLAVAIEDMACRIEGRSRA